MKGRYFLPRNPDRKIIFLSSWHLANMKFAAQLLGRHQSEVTNIHWDVVVDGKALQGRDRWYRRFYNASGNKKKQRYGEHECFPSGHVIGINCVVPAAISDDDFLELMRISGQYRGLSPYKPGDFGHFELVSVRLRRALAPPPPEGGLVESVDEELRSQEIKKPTS